MADFILRDFDPGEWQQRIIDGVVAKLTSVNPRTDWRHPLCASREEMAVILGWSISKLDRRTQRDPNTGEAAIPSIMDEGRRTFVVQDVVAALTKERKARKSRLLSVKPPSCWRRS